MQTEVHNSPQKRGRLNIITISLIVFIILMLAAAATFTYATLKYNNIYSNAYVNSLNVSGMSKTELTDYLNKKFQSKLKSLEFVLKTDLVFERFNSSDLEAVYDINATVEKVYGIGRTGSIFDRIYDIIVSATNGISFNMLASYDKELLDGFITSFCDKTLINVNQPVISIQEDKVTIRSGRHGESIDRNIVLSKVKTLIRKCKGGKLEVKVRITAPNKLNVDELYEQIYREPADASFKIENNIITPVPHVIGRKIEKAALSNILSELDKTEDIEKILPIDFIKPKITAEDANALLFKDQLAYMSTNFSTSTQNDKNRGENMKIATALISGKILAPSDVFSFNATVGPRTEDAGYQKAHTYSAGKVIDSIGGGVCQITSTLYNAVLKADLEVIERRNHTFTVGYVPYGQDATVSYNTADFKFKNSTNWPIKIDTGVTKNNNVYFKLIGTNETPDKKVIITTKILKKKPFTTKYIDDPTLLEGETQIKQEGKEGYVIDTFKTIKLGDNVISQAKLHTSTYIPLEHEILRGTKKPVTNPIITVPNQTPAPAVPAPQPTPAPSQPIIGIDDADNPPAP